MEYIASETRILRKISTDTIEIVFYDHATLTVENVLEDSRIYDRFTKNKRYKKLVIIGLHTESDLETRQQIAVENRKRKSKIIAEALVAKTPLTKARGTIYQLLLRQPYPCRIFSSRAKALEWLNEFK